MKKKITSQKTNLKYTMAFLDPEQVILSLANYKIMCKTIYEQIQNGSDILIINMDKPTSYSIKNHITDNNEFLPGFYTFLSKYGTSVNIKKIINVDQIDNNIFWVDTNAQNCFLYQIDLPDYMKSEVILCKFIYNNSTTVHVNYNLFINDNYETKVKEEERFKNFIGFINYIYDYFNENDIVYYSVSGNARISSVLWKKYIQYKFNTGIYISPGSESHFYINKKSKYETPVFFFISKLLASKKINFALQEPLFYTSNRYIMNIELYENEPSLINYSNIIFEQIKRKKKSNPNIIVDALIDDDINLYEYDLKIKNQYKFIL